jgi:branched-subunit amino acid transport protein AzlD
MIHAARFGVGAVFLILFILTIDGIDYAIQHLGIGNIVSWAAVMFATYVCGALIVSIYNDVQSDRRKRR